MSSHGAVTCGPVYQCLHWAFAQQQMCHYPYAFTNDVDLLLISKIDHNIVKIVSLRNEVMNIDGLPSSVL